MSFFYSSIILFILFSTPPHPIPHSINCLRCSKYSFISTTYVLLTTLFKNYSAVYSFPHLILLVPPPLCVSFSITFFTLLSSFSLRFFLLCVFFFLSFFLHEFFFPPFSASSCATTSSSSHCLPTHALPSSSLLPHHYPPRSSPNLRFSHLDKINSAIFYNSPNLRGFPRAIFQKRMKMIIILLIPTPGKIWERIYVLVYSFRKFKALNFLLRCNFALYTH